MINLQPELLKNILTKAGIIDGKTFDEINKEALRRRQNPLELIISQGLVNKDYLYLILSNALNVERVNLGAIDIDRKVLNLIPVEIARQKKVILFGQNADGSYNAAMENPTDLETINFLSSRLGAPIHPFLADENDLNKGFSLYGEKQTQDFKKIIEEKIKESLRSKAKGIEEAAQDLPIVSIVDALMAYAISSRASDIHFEALDDKVLVRFRIDGVMREIIRMPKEIQEPIVARIKILSGLRIDEHSRPQDGRFRHRVSGILVDVRVSVIPTFYGEKVVMRLLSSTQKPLSFEDLGMLPDTAKILKEAISTSYGMILASGPTGSGKTTTLYSILNVLNRPEVNIVTIEDPIEYDMRYVNQTQVNEAAGITFARGLRSILRQDPNIIMVGEIRDEDTAEISVQAALTGHLVLSSLHTNDAPTAVPRLMDMGIKPFLVAAVLNLVNAQRLVRKIHRDCIVSYTPPKSVYEAIYDQLRQNGVDPSTVKLPKTFYRGQGCEADNYTGYMGRIGIFEVMKITEKIRNYIISPDFALDGLRKLAQQEGMKTMFEDGLRKVERGMTTIEEVFRVIKE